MVSSSFLRVLFFHQGMGDAALCRNARRSLAEAWPKPRWSLAKALPKLHRSLTDFWFYFDLFCIYSRILSLCWCDFDLFLIISRVGIRALIIYLIIPQTDLICGGSGGTIGPINLRQLFTSSCVRKSINISLDVCTFEKQIMLSLQNWGPPHHGTTATATLFSQTSLFQGFSNIFRGRGGRATLATAQATFITRENPSSPALFGEYSWWALA